MEWPFHIPNSKKSPTSSTAARPSPCRVDAKNAFIQAAARETHPDAKRALLAVIDNADTAVAQQSSMCGDTGLPRFYAKVGNDVQIEGGFVNLERALRQATVRATKDVPLRSNRVHPLTRRNPGTNVGVMAPNVDYRFEPEGDWIDLTAVHKGGLFGSDYRMLFPGDGIPGIKRFFVDTLVSFGHRGLSCPPVIVGVGIGGAKDQCVTLGKEASCLRLVGDRHPDPLVADLELELLELGNSTMIGIMGFQSDTPVTDVHVEIAYTHTGGLPIGISELCHAVRRATARVYNDGRVEYREDPQWFTPYYRREGAEYVPGEPQPSTKGGEGMKGLAALGREAPRSDERRDRSAQIRNRHQRQDEGPPRVKGVAPQHPAAGRRRPPAPRRRRRLPHRLHLHRPRRRLQIHDRRRPRAADSRSATSSTSRPSRRRPAPKSSPGKYMVNSLQATAGFRYAQWMDRLMERHGVRAVLNKGGMSQQMYQTVFKKHGAVCLSTMPYGIGAIYGKAVTGVRDVYWKELLGISEAMWLLEVKELGPLLVDGDSEGNSYVADHAEEVNAPLIEIYKDLPQLILKRFGEVTDPTEELIK